MLSGVDGWLLLLQRLRNALWQRVWRGRFFLLFFQALVHKVASAATVLTFGEEAVMEVQDFEVPVYLPPSDCSVGWVNRPLVGQCQPEVPVVLQTCVKIEAVKMLYHLAMVDEDIVIVLRVIVEMCLTEGNPGLGPPCERVYFILFRFVVESEGPSGGIGNDGRLVRVHIDLLNGLVVGQEVLEGHKFSLFNLLQEGLLDGRRKKWVTHTAPR